MTSNKTTKTRIRKSTLQCIRDALPHVKNDRDRIDILYKSSAVRVEKVLKDSDIENKLGKFLYGNKGWNKIKKKR